MSVNIFEAAAEIKKGIAIYGEVQAVAHALDAVKVDGLSALEEVKKLIGEAVAHKDVIEQMIKDIEHPATLEADLIVFIKRAADHTDELGKVVDGVKALVGGELSTIHSLIAAGELKKLEALAK